MNCMKLLKQISGLPAILLLMAACSSPPSAPKSVTLYRVGTIVPPTVPVKAPIAQAKPESSLPTVKFNSTFIVLQFGQLRFVLMDKYDRSHLLSKLVFYNDRIISDIEAQYFEARKLMEENEPEMDSLGKMPLTAFN